MGPRDAQGVKQANSIVGHIVESVRGSRPVALGGEARIPVVEADHVKTTGGEVLAERVVPMDQLIREANDEKQREAMGVSRSIVLDLYSVGLRL